MLVFPCSYPSVGFRIVRFHSFMGKFIFMVDYFNKTYQISLGDHYTYLDIMVNNFVIQGHKY